jgi:cysteine desulfurase
MALGAVAMTAPEPIYLDAFATTPIAPEALAALNAQLQRPGNAHSPHASGALAAAAVERARLAVAQLIGADAQEIIFTSGATEANNLAILGLARAAASGGSPRRTIITSTIEHPSVSAPATALVAEGFRHLEAPVSEDGRLDLEALRGLLTEDVLLVAVMAANNITGVVQPIAEVVREARAVGALVHVDAAQAAGKIPLDVCALDLDSLSLSGHKLYGPPGIGALFLASTSPMKPSAVVHGGGQERGLRSGTLPTALISGLGVAAQIAAERMADDASRLRILEAQFRAALSERKVRVRLNGAAEHRLPGAMNLALLGADADHLVELLASRVALSTGSACSSGQISVATTLKSMGLSKEISRSSVRIYFSRYSTEQDADLAAEAIAEFAPNGALAPGDLVQ